MNIVQKSEQFALQAHDGMVRKADPDKPYAVHLIDVANKLASYGFQEEVIAAGYLHDTIEDVPTVTLEQIEKEFGYQIASLVKGATESSRLNKSNSSKKIPSWEERKQETIKRIKTLDLEHKAIVCTDKVSNLEDISILFGKNGEKNFRAFKRGYDYQKWYYEEVYNSLIQGENSNLQMFQDLKQLIILVFSKKDFFPNDYQNILKYKKKELQKLQTLFPQEKNSSPINLNIEALDKDTLYLLKEYLESICLINDFNLEPDLILFPKTNSLTIYQKKLNNLSPTSLYHSYSYNLSPNPNLNQAQIIINILMNIFYQETLTDVKIKIKKIISK